ncbi:SapC protein [Duganella sp. CF517]|uniref:SapC family protein n=1 Tax=Duganella sp. CF517 TaxID=1881038 RepID=UPI0008B191C6|nr:SapC family protein [Duganella sp. CF517]SEO53099.1 SapC protein [Duganella sp. CF517]
MPKPVLLNNVEHKNLRVITRRGARFGDAQMAAPTFPAEFRNIQACYPIVFRQTTDGLGFEPIALLGFQEGENLFLQGERWDAVYIPMLVERQPFLIGMGGAGGQDLTVHIDIENPRVSDSEGEEVFKPHGGTTDYLERVNSLLAAIHNGMQDMPLFLATLVEHELLESFVLDVGLDDGSQNRLAGFYTINEDRLAGLSGDVIAKLHAGGHLHHIYMVLASLSNFRALIDRKNALHA